MFTAFRFSLENSKFKSQEGKRISLHTCSSIWRRRRRQRGFLRLISLSLVLRRASAFIPCASACGAAHLVFACVLRIILSLQAKLIFRLFSFSGRLKTLLSENAPEESRWPPELILLREKFTAKSQLEIAQLQIRHEEEVSESQSHELNELNFEYFISSPDVESEERSRAADESQAEATLEFRRWPRSAEMRRGTVSTEFDSQEIIF